jgi:hypothetical protein
MDYFQEPYLPTKFYRVQYPGCQTSYSEEHVLSARDKSTIPTNIEQLGRFVEESFTWGSTTCNPFINLFSEKDHAVNWAIKESERTNQNYLVISIDTSDLKRSHVIKLSTVVQNLNITIPEGARSHIHNAYLYLHEIPARSICSVETSEELMRG